MTVSIKVVVVDDTEHVRRMLCEMLELDGFDVVGEAESGKEAVALVPKKEPDVVIMDYKMPIMDGLTAARAIREDVPGQAIVLYTAYLDDDVEREAQKAGVSLCVGKIEGLTTLERDIRRLAGELF